MGAGETDCLPAAAAPALEDLDETRLGSSKLVQP